MGETVPGRPGGRTSLDGQLSNPFDLDPLAFGKQASVVNCLLLVSSAHGDSEFLEGKDCAGSICQSPTQTHQQSRCHRKVAE